MKDKRLVVDGGKCFAGSFNGVNRTVNRIQLKLVLCRVFTTMDGAIWLH